MKDRPGGYFSTAFSTKEKDKGKIFRGILTAKADYRENWQYISKNCRAFCYFYSMKSGENEKIGREVCKNYGCFVNYVKYGTVFLCTFPLDF